MEILSKVSWSGPALKLISYVHELNPSSSVFMIIRHSAREESEDIQKILNAPLTKQGKKAAFEFGQSLPSHFTYHFHHSIIERCKETALCIEKGVRYNGGNTRYQGNLETLTHIKGNSEKIIEFIGRDQENFIRYWMQNQYPPELIEPPLNLAKRTASELMKIFQNNHSPSTIHVFVTHDIHILIYLFYWAKIEKFEEWVQYLEGFILQLKENKLEVYHERGKKELNYPEWWTFS